MTDREEFEKFLKDNFLYDTSGFIQNEAERKKAQDESFVWRAWQARGELEAVKINGLELALEMGAEEYRHTKAELTAKLDKARDGNCCTEGCIKCDARKVLAETQEPIHNCPKCNSLYTKEIHSIPAQPSWQAIGELDVVRIKELEAKLDKAKEALKWIDKVNAMDSEYVRVARQALEELDI